MKRLTSAVLTLLATCLFIAGFGVHNAQAKATLTIYADQYAVNPEVRSVEAGNTVTFSAYGTWSPTESITCGPEGIGETAGDTFAYPGKPKYSLCLYFLTSTDPRQILRYYIGCGTTITFSQSGTFFLQINYEYSAAGTPSGYVTVNLQAGEASGVEPAEATGWQNPVTTQSYRTFQSTVFSEKVEPVAAEKEKKEKGVMKPSEASSAVEYEFFKIGGQGGNNLTINLGYARTNDNQTRSYGVNAYLNNLKFDSGGSFNNSNFSFFGKQTIKETETSSVSLGLTVDYLLLDRDYSDDNGLGVGAMASGINRFGKSMLSWGGMYQYAKLGDYTEHLANIGLMYGQPVGELFAVTADLYGTYKMSASFNGANVDIDEPFMLNLGLYGDFYISRAFMINGGVKEVLFVNDYKSTEIVIGTKLRF